MAHHLIPADRKLDGLHGLRGVAAMAVVLFHLHHIPGIPVPGWAVPAATHFGLSVHLFFVLSAFSLHHSAVMAPTGVAAYLVKRFMRIAPLFYLLALYQLWRSGWPGWGVLASNLTFTFNLVPGHEQSLNWAGWSVGVEMVFYLMLPAILAAFRGVAGLSCLFVLSAGMAVLAWMYMRDAPGLPPNFAYFSIAGNLVVFTAGLLGYALWRGPGMRLAGGRGGRIVLGLGAMALLVFAWTDPLQLQAYVAGLYFTVWGIAFAAICVWQSIHPSMLLRSAPMQWLADRSFSIYLLHPVAIVVLRPLFDRVAALGLPEGGWVYLACLAVLLPPLLGAAAVTYRFVELPGIALGRTLAARLDAARRPRPVTEQAPPRPAGVTTG